MPFVVIVFLANALEYAGLQFREHITETAVNALPMEPAIIEKMFHRDNQQKVPVLDLTSFWKQALVRLLDM